MIHPTACVHPTVCVPNSCRIGPFCVVEKGVHLGENVILDAHVVLKEGCWLEEDVVVHSQVVLGDDPQIANQDFHFKSGVWIGAQTILREGVTVHRASQEGKYTRIGKRCLLMVGAHVGHDTCVADDCILANQTLLAGCVSIQSHVFLSGGSMVHQFCHVGESAFVAGNAVVTMHVPPFTMVLERNCASNLNVVGLKRRGFTSNEVADVKKAYRYVYATDSLSFRKKAEEYLRNGFCETQRGRQFLEFFLQEKADRGFVYPNIH